MWPNILFKPTIDGLFVTRTGLLPNRKPMRTAPPPGNLITRRPREKCHTHHSHAHHSDLVVVLGCFISRSAKHQSAGPVKGAFKRWWALLVAGGLNPFVLCLSLSGWGHRLDLRGRPTCWVDEQPKLVHVSCFRLSCHDDYDDDWGLRAPHCPVMDRDIFWTRPHQELD